MAAAINADLTGGTASAIDSGRVRIALSGRDASDAVALMSRIANQACAVGGSRRCRCSRVLIW